MNMNVIITGANRGIGKACAEAFVNNGDNVWACCRRADDVLRSWAEVNTFRDRWVKIVEFNLTDENAVTNGFNSIMKDHLPVDVLVNAAGIGHMGMMQMTSLSEIRRIYEVNVFALMRMCQLAVNLMRRRKSGIIINISSTAAQEIYAGNSIYGSSKAAVAAFTQSLAAELAPYSIRVNAIAPGLTDTDMSSIFEGGNPKLPLERSALGRKLKPSEVADAVVALTSDKLRMINGQVIKVNGGSK